MRLKHDSFLFSQTDVNKEGPWFLKDLQSMRLNMCIERLLSPNNNKEWSGSCVAVKKGRRVNIFRLVTIFLADYMYLSEA